MDPGEEICKDRAKTDDRPEGTIEAIEQWHLSPPTIPEEHITNELTIHLGVLRANPLMHIK